MYSPLMMMHSYLILHAYLPSWSLPKIDDVDVKFCLFGMRVCCSSVCAHDKSTRYNTSTMRGYCEEFTYTVDLFYFLPREATAHTWKSHVANFQNRATQRNKYSHSYTIGARSVLWYSVAIRTSRCPIFASWKTSRKHSVYSFTQWTASEQNQFLFISSTLQCW